MSHHDHHSHDHSHGGSGGGGHGHSHGDHDHSHDVAPALQSSLYQQIDFPAIITLNEAESRSGAAICQKTWEQRMDAEPELKSDADEQLIMNIPSVLSAS